jgi:hypothetical protein
VTNQSNSADGSEVLFHSGFLLRRPWPHAHRDRLVRRRSLGGSKARSGVPRGRRLGIYATTPRNAWEHIRHESADLSRRLPIQVRPDLGPADSAATTSSTVVYAGQQGRLHRPGGKEDSQHKIRRRDLHPAAVTSLINLGLGGTGLAQTTARSGWTASSH